MIHFKEIGKYHLSVKQRMETLSRSLQHDQTVIASLVSSTAALQSKCAFNVDKL